MNEQRNWTETDDGRVRVHGRYGFDGMLLEPSQCNEIHVKLGSGEGYFNQDDLTEAVRATRPDAGLLATPVDGKLREAMEVTLDRHGWTLTEDGCHCGDYDPDDDNSMDSHLTDKLLPIIATHVAERERTAKEQGWDDAVRWLKHNREAIGRDALDRDFNPHRVGGG